MDVPPDDARRGRHGAAFVDADPQSHADTTRPGMGREGGLDLRARADRGRRVGEYDEERVSLGVHFASTVSRDDLSYDRGMGGEHLAVPCAEPFEEARGPL